MLAPDGTKGIVCVRLSASQDGTKDIVRIRLSASSAAEVAARRWDEGFVRKQVQTQHNPGIPNSFVSCDRKWQKQETGNRIMPDVGNCKLEPPPAAYHLLTLTSLQAIQSVCPEAAIAEVYGEIK